MSNKKDKMKAEPAYWCTCSDNPETCLGCGIDRLVFKVMGEIGSIFLKNRTYNIRKQTDKK